MKFSILVFLLFSVFQTFGQKELINLTIKYGRNTTYTLDFLNPYHLAHFDNKLLFKTALEYDSVDFYLLKFEGRKRLSGDTLVLNPDVFTICHVFPILHHKNKIDTLGLTTLKMKSFYYPVSVINGVELIRNDTVIIDRAAEYNYHILQRPDYPLTMSSFVSRLVIRIDGKTHILESTRQFKKWSNLMNQSARIEILYIEIKINDNPPENYILDTYIKIE